MNHLLPEGPAGLLISLQAAISSGRVIRDLDRGNCQDRQSSGSLQLVIVSHQQRHMRACRQGSFSTKLDRRCRTSARSVSARSWLIWSFPHMSRFFQGQLVICGAIVAEQKNCRGVSPMAAKAPGEFKGDDPAEAVPVEGERPSAAATIRSRWEVQQVRQLRHRSPGPPVLPAGKLDAINIAVPAD